MSPNFFGEYDAKHGVDLDPQPTQQSPVVSYNLGKPMGLQDYIKLPDHAQKEYLLKLKKEHGASAAQIGQMFGISTEDACELMRESGVSAKGKRAANADELWAAFLGDYQIPEPAPRFTLSEEEPPAETTEGAPEGDPQPEPEPEPRPAPPKPPEVSTVLRAFRVDLSGPIDAVMRRMSVFAAIVGNRNVTVTLSCDEDAEL